MRGPVITDRGMRTRSHQLRALRSPPHKARPRRYCLSIISSSNYSRAITSSFGMISLTPICTSVITRHRELLIIVGQPTRGGVFLGLTLMLGQYARHYKLDRKSTRLNSSHV